MSLRKATNEDPRGIIAEAYNIPDIDSAMARDIFLGWALKDAGENAQEAMKTLYLRYSREHPFHPMTELLHQGLEREPVRRRSRNRRNAE